MSVEDMENIVFVIDDGIFCYIWMPFGLKNAGAEFQQMVNKLFGNQINRNMDVYVDDLIIKSKKPTNLPIDMIEMFPKIWAAGMKLNLKKCVFKVPSGNYLGFIVSGRGIEANPAKIKAVQEMRTPKNVKDIQRLSGCVALHVFVKNERKKTYRFTNFWKKPTPLYGQTIVRKPLTHWKWLLAKSLS